MRRRTTVDRRRWNNRLILGIIIFMLLLNAPTLIKQLLLEPHNSTSAPLLYLLAPQYPLQALYFGQYELIHDGKEWQSSALMRISETEMVKRWQNLQGSVVDLDSFEMIKSQLPAPQTIEVWYHSQEEPQRITLYQTESYWLMMNWQQQWIAVSVDEHYLLPVAE